MTRRRVRFLLVLVLCALPETAHAIRAVPEHEAA